MPLPPQRLDQTQGIERNRTIGSAMMPQIALCVAFAAVYGHVQRVSAALRHTAGRDVQRVNGAGMHDK